MDKLFPSHEKSFGSASSRARFLWLLIAALLLPIAASLSQGSRRSERFESLMQGSVRVENR